MLLLLLLVGVVVRQQPPSLTPPIIACSTNPLFFPFDTHSTTAAATLTFRVHHMSVAVLQEREHGIGIHG